MLTGAARAFLVEILKCQLCRTLTRILGSLLLPGQDTNNSNTRRSRPGERGADSTAATSPAVPLARQVALVCVNERAHPPLALKLRCFSIYHFRCFCAIKKNPGRRSTLGQDFSQPPGN